MITNKNDLYLWLKSIDLNIPMKEIPEVNPPIRNSKWEDIDHELSDIEYRFKFKTEKNYNIQKCVIWVRKSKQQLELRLIRPCPVYTRYGKIKPRFISVDKEQDLFSSKDRFTECIQLLYPEYDFTIHRYSND